MIQIFYWMISVPELAGAGDRAGSMGFRVQYALLETARSMGFRVQYALLDILPLNTPFPFSCGEVSKCFLVYDEKKSVKISLLVAKEGVSYHL